MKKFFLIMLLIAVFVFVFVFFTLDKTAEDYMALAEKSMKNSKPIDAIRYYELSGNLWQKNAKYNEYIKSINEIGVVYYTLTKYDKAIEYFKKALIIAKKHDNKGEIITGLNNIGAIYYSLGQYNRAIKNFRKNLKLAEEQGDKTEISIGLNNIGMVYDAWGKYDKAIKNYKKTLAIAKEDGHKNNITASLNNIGRIYDSWGQYSKAIKNFKKALIISRAQGNEGNVAVYLSNIGRSYASLGLYDEALEYYNKALIIDKKLGRRGKVATRLSDIGNQYYSLKQYDKAIINHKKALNIAIELGEKREIATRLSNIGKVYYALGQYNMAMDNYNKALAIDKKIGRKTGIALRLNNIGVLYYTLKDYKKAENNFNKAILIIEQIRLTAKGTARLDYLSSQIKSYQYLISTYIKNNKPNLAFNTIELSSSKYLIEQMGEKLNSKNLRFKGIKNYQKKIEDNHAIINYSNLNWTEFSQIIVEKNNIYAVEVDKSNFISKINKKYKKIISNMTDGLRGVRVKNKKALNLGDIKAIDSSSFDKIINYYRILIAKPNLSTREARIANEISKELYLLLFNKIEKQLKGKKNLTILPDGILSFLPFESLIMPDGRYLIEKYHIKYTQALAVSDIIEKRNYNKKRKSLLAFGGAIYDEISYNSDMIKSEKQLKKFQKNTLLAINRGQSFRNAYFEIGITNWKNLPGTIVEVKSIIDIVKDSELSIGKDVDEYILKELSKKGDLKKYKVLHFATHGLVVPEMPELSAIVLSQFKEEQNNEDGYLTMKEIVKLDINADFINLSGCDTGLGKIYGGEGVVGLTQSFLIAGANGLSVSLWQVADKSTGKFMTEVYRLVNEKGYNYDKAITMTKRMFISDNESYNFSNKKTRGFRSNMKNGLPKIDFKNPFYWAPFVYYGK